MRQHRARHAVRVLQRIFRAQHESRLYFRAVTTVNFAALLGQPRMRCRRVGHLHREEMDAELLQAMVGARSQFLVGADRKIDKYDLVRWAWIPKNRQVPVFEIRNSESGMGMAAWQQQLPPIAIANANAGTTGTAGTATVQLAVVPPADFQIGKAPGDENEKGTNVDSKDSIVLLPVLGKTVKAQELFGRVEVSQVCRCRYRYRCRYCSRHLMPCMCLPSFDWR